MNRLSELIDTVQQTERNNLLNKLQNKLISNPCLLQSKDNHYIALKKIVKCTLFCERHPLNLKAKTRLYELHTKYDNNQYDEVSALYDGFFSIRDQKEADNFFLNDTSRSYFGSRDGAMYSYIKGPDGKAIRRDKELGAGGFGRVKQDERSTMAIKRQIIQPNTAGRGVIQEATYNYDLNLSENSNISTHQIGTVIKYYNTLKLGTPLLNVLLTCTDDQRIDYAIQLLTAVENLHTGKTSRTRKKYAHLDIKPDNILVDKDGKLFLIDYGLSKCEDLEVLHKANCGTIEYMPHNKLLVRSAYINLTTDIIQTPTYFFDDQIAALRTIYHPCYPDKSIFTKSMWDALPDNIKNILNTSSISKCITENRTISHIISALQNYKDILSVTLSPVLAPVIVPVSTSTTTDLVTVSFSDKKDPVPENKYFILDTAMGTLSNLNFQIYDGIDVQLNSAVNNLRYKSMDFINLYNKTKNKEFADAAEASYQLTTEIRQLILENQSNIASISFKQSSSRIISKYKKELETLRDYNKGFSTKQLLLDLVNAICTVCSLGTTRLASGRFRLFQAKSDSCKLIENLEKNINTPKP